MEFNSRVDCYPMSLSLFLTLHDSLIVQVEITNDFVPEQWINWSDGQEGLKVPTASIKLQANNWQPKVGQVQLSCILHDGIKQVAIKTITVKHDGECCSFSVF